MKLLVISAAFPPVRAGEADHALQICLRLAAAGVDVHVLTSRGNEAGASLPFRVMPVMDRWNWLELPRLARCINGAAPDCILLIYSGWIFRDHPMITFAPTIARRLLPGVRVVTQMETDAAPKWGGLATKTVRKLARIAAGAATVDYAFGTLLRDSQHVIALSEQHLARFEALLPGVSRRSTVIPPPPLMRMSADTSATRAGARAKLGASDAEFLLAFFGYVDRNKGIETLFKALEIVSRRHRHVRLVMTGGGRGTAAAARTARARTVSAEEQELLDLPQAMGIGGQVTWTPGYQWDSDEGSTWLRAADAVVLPFDAGITLNRSSFAAAAAHGLPIVTTSGPVVETAFRSGENCLLCAPGDPDALAQAIQSVVENAGLRATLRLGALALADEWFSWERAIEKTMRTLTN